MNDEKRDANPWDDDDGGRTLATDGPSFEMPSNIPSPITPPPPAPPPTAVSRKHPPKATLVGLMPEDFLAGLSGAEAPRQAATPRAHPRPVTIPDDALDDLRPRDDSPTMASASSAGFPLPGAAARPDGYARADRINDDEHAETVALRRPESRLPNLADEPEPEEATRALVREEMMGKPSAHQDAHVIVGSGAVGDDATLAIGPNALNTDLGELGASLDPALAEALAQRSADRHPHAQHPHAPPAPPPFFSQPATGHAPYVHPQPPPQSWQDAPSRQEPAPAAYTPSGSHPAMGGLPPSQPMPWGSNPHAPTAPAYALPQQQLPQQQLPQQGMMAPQQAPWMPPAAPLPEPPTRGGGRTLGGIRMTSQVMILAGVGVVCLGVFVIGLVLFFTTKF